MRTVIVGAGRYGEVFLDYLRTAGHEIVGFLDDGPLTNVGGVPVLGKTKSIAAMKRIADAAFVSIGANDVRLHLIDRAAQAGLAVPSFVHPSAVIPQGVAVPDGTYVMQSASVMPFVRLGRGCIISMSANVAHHTSLDNGAFVSTGANVGAGVAVGRCAFIGIGATVTTGVGAVGASSIVGAGAVVIHDVEPRSVVAGVPARHLRYID